MENILGKSMALVLPYLVSLVAGFYLCYYLTNVGNGSIAQQCEKDSIENIDSHTLPAVEAHDARKTLTEVEHEDLEEIISRPFACNARLGLEELSKLHQNRVKLGTRRSKGEANRDRTANIIRKAGKAEAAESAFRTCVQVLMPEVLKFWDERSIEGKLVFNSKKYENDGGIDIHVLEETADRLDETSFP